MVLSKEEAETLYQHVFFPPKTPNRPDSEDEHDLALRYFAETFKSFVVNVPPSLKPICQTLNADITHWAELYNGHTINEDQTLKALNRMKTNGK